MFSRIVCVIEWIRITYFVYHPPMGSWVVSTMGLLWWLFPCQFDWIERFLERQLDHEGAILTAGLIHLCSQLNVLWEVGPSCRQSLAMGLGERISCWCFSSVLCFPAATKWAARLYYPFHSDVPRWEPANHRQNALKMWAEYTSLLSRGYRVFCPAKEEWTSTSIGRNAATDLNAWMCLQASAFNF